MKTKKHTATMTRYTPDSSLNDQSSSVPSTEGTQKPTEEAPLQTPGGSSSQEGRQYQASAQLSGKQLETATKPAEVWWLARLKEHPFKAFSLAVSVYGGLILLAFFTHLGSMPDLDLAGATATVAAVAVIGLLVIFTLGGSTIAAGVVTRSLASYVPHLASLRSLMFLAAPGGILLPRWWFLSSLRKLCRPPVGFGSRWLSLFSSPRWGAGISSRTKVSLRQNQESKAERNANHRQKAVRNRYWRMAMLRRGARSPRHGKSTSPTLRADSYGLFRP